MNRFLKESVVAGLLGVTLAGPASTSGALAFNYIDQQGYRHWNFYGGHQHRHAARGTHMGHRRFAHRHVPAAASVPPNATTAPVWAGKLVPVRAHDLGSQ